MTVKQLFDKVDNYNEIADVMGTEKMVIGYSDKYVFSREKFENVKEFRHFIRSQYIKEVADSILNGDYEFFTETPIMGHDRVFNVWFSLITC